MRADWFWNTGNLKTLKTVPELMSMYEESVGHGSVLLLNNTPDRTGLIPGQDVARAEEFGAEIRRVFGQGSAIASVSGKGNELSAQPSAPTVIDRVVIMEDLSGGERVRAYEVDFLVDGGWKTVARGDAVGHKRIVRVTPTRAESVRVRITKSAGEPIIRRLSLHRASKEEAGAPGR
jgi:alpha-L-fucosidase